MKDIRMKYNLISKFKIKEVETWKGIDIVVEGEPYREHSLLKYNLWGFTEHHRTIKNNRMEIIDGSAKIFQIEVSGALDYIAVDRHFVPVAAFGESRHTFALSAACCTFFHAHPFRANRLAVR